MSRLIALATALTLTPFLVAQDTDEGFVVLTPDQMEWETRANGLDAVYLEGHPESEGFYVLRYTFPAGTFSSPHFHDQDRFITVISGVWHAGIGPSGDRDNPVPLTAGSYMKHPAGAAHYDGAKDEPAVVEIRGMGPVQTIFVDESGEPQSPPE